MADLVQTAANVVNNNAGGVQGVTFGATVTAGMPLCLFTDGKYYPASNNTTNKKSAAGIALNGGAAGQPGTIQTGGQINLGATLVVGTAYVVSATAGNIAPSTDLTTAHDYILLGVAISASILQMPPGGPFVPGATLP